MSNRSGGALFSGGGSRNATTSKALVEFRAGKMNLSGTTVTPDKRRGQVLIEQGDDQLMHFKWKDRGTGQIEDDLIIFPDDIEFKKVGQCTTGRVFILKFKSSTQKLFFWMQEPKEDRDEEFCKKVNDYLNNPPAPGSTPSGSSSRAGGSGGSGGPSGSLAGIPGLDLSNLGDSELQSLLNNMSQQQLMQLFGGGGGGLSSLLGGGGSSGGSSGRQRSTARAQAAAAAAASASPALSSGTAASATTPASSKDSSNAGSATPTTTTTSSSASASKSTAGNSSATPLTSSSGAPIQLADLQSILSGIQVPAGLTSGATATAAASTGPAIDLSSGLSMDVLQPLLENPEFVRKMKELLPSEELDREDARGEIRGTLQSPQFQQALGIFSSGLQTGQLAPLIREFDLGDAAIAAATSGDMEAFVKALQNKKDSSPPSEAKKEDEDDDDDGMALD